jgi:hypothetical protein
MKVRRASDDAEADIGFDSNGDLDTAAIATHCGASAGYVSVWYDQANIGGTPNNATQSTTSAQPQIYNGTSVLTENGKPAVEFDGVTEHLSLSYTGIGAETNKFISLVATSNDATFRRRPLSFSNSGATRVSMWYDDASSADFTGNGFANSVSASATVSSQHLLIGQDIATNQAIYVNASAGGTNTSGGTTTDTNQGFIGVHDPAQGSAAARQNHSGPVQEIILWPSDQSSNRTGIESDINTYFSIY